MDERTSGILGQAVSRTDVVHILVIVVLVITCTLVTALSFSRSFSLISYQLFFIPILYATYFFARRGLVVAGICGITYQTVGYYFRFPNPGALMGVTSEAILFIIIASLITYFIEKIRAGEARYRSVFEHSQLGIVLLDLPGFRIKQTNNKFAAMLRYAPSDVEKTAFPALAFSYDERRRFLDQWEKNHNCENFETRFRTKDDEICWVNLSWSALDEHTVSVTIENITARKQIEKIHSDTMQKYRQLTENSPTSILVIQNGKIRFSNPAFATFSGYDIQEIEGTEVSILIDSPDREKFREFMQPSGSRNSEGRGFRFITKGGGFREAMVFTNPIIHDNQPAVMMNLVDISVQQRLEEKIQQDNERRRGIITTVAHELRTPLQPILGYLNLLIQDAESFGILDDAKKMLERCLVSVERERQIINQMLELSVLESGKIQLAFSDFLLSALVHSVVDSCGYITKADVKMEIPPDLVISADRDRLYNVIDSILSNAVNYSKPPRVIQIVYLPADGGSVHRISVKDNGIGISESQFTSIFEPFQLADAAKLSRKYNRLGLSLSIAKKVIRMHGGDITVESTVNVGSTFTIHIPRELPKEIIHVE